MPGVGGGGGHRGRGECWAAVSSVALSRTAAEVVALTNAERGRAGLPPLAVDPLLMAAAQAHCAAWWAATSTTTSAPTAPRPGTGPRAAGSRRRTIGENLACGQRSPAEVVDGWTHSPGRRANILEREFGHMGVGFGGRRPGGHLLDPAVRWLTGHVL
jgi:uncharacterized protein YkwD